MYVATVPLPTAVGPASTTSRESAVPRRVVGLVERKSRSRSRWCLPRPPRRLDGEISRWLMMRCILVTPMAGMLMSSSVTRNRPSMPVGSFTAAARTSRAVRCPVATWAFTAALARRAATAAREAATRSTSGGVGRLSATGGSCFGYSAGNRLVQPVWSGPEHAARFTHDNASGVSPVQLFEVGDLGTLVPEAGREDGGQRAGRRGGHVDAEASQVEGRAEHDPDRAEWAVAGPQVPVRDVVEDGAGDGRPGAGTLGDDRALDGGGLGVGGRGEDEHALPARSGEVQDGVERTDAHIGVHRDGVDLERRARAEPGLAVRFDTGAEVSALDVGDDEQAGLAGIREHALECCVPGRAEPLEERHLRLDDAGPPGGRLDDPPAERLGARRRVRQSPVGEQPGVRVDADAQPAPFGEHLREAIAERNTGCSALAWGHSAAARVMAYSCSEVTSVSYTHLTLPTN